jgi:PD-(D/E)XK nuclease superfamily
MPKLKTLIPDIQEMLLNVIKGKTKEIPDEKIDALAKRIAEKVRKMLTARPDAPPPSKTIYMSEIGQPCKRKLWYSRQPSNKILMKENLLPNNLLKFLYGDILEELVLFLAEAAEHKVRDYQQRVEVPVGNDWKVVGKMDAIIDDQVIDVKSASSYSFKKFASGLTPAEDSFGYIPQLTGYVGALRIINPGVSEEQMNDAAFVVIDKTTGNLTLDVHSVDESASNLDKTARGIVKILEKDTPPDREFTARPHSHGSVLDVNCSYCPYKFECWKEANEGAGIRTFVYSTGPVFMVAVDKEPKVIEITQKIKEADEKAKPVITKETI